MTNIRHSKIRPLMVMAVAVVAFLTLSASAHAIWFDLDVKGPESLRLGDTGTATADYVIGNDIFVVGEPNSDPQRTDVTSKCIWKSSSPEVASIDASGKITPLAVGTTTISAAYEEASRSGSFQLTVKPALISIRGAVAYDKANKKIVRGKSRYAYNKGFICPVSYLMVNNQKVDRSNLVCYYYKNRSRGTASVIVKGINDKGYKDAILLSYKIV